MTRYNTLFSITLCLTLISTMLYGQSWEVLFTYPDAILNDVFFIDNSSGWVVGGDGLVLHTNDGGDSWDVIDIGTVSWLEAIFFSNDQNGWIVGDSGTIFHTVDGGIIWVKQETEVIIPLRDIFFINDSIGWAVGSSMLDGVVIKTMDSGKNWSTVSEKLSGSFLSVHFIDEMEGWVVGGISLFDNFSDPIIWHTMNGGESWEDQEWPQYFYGPLVKILFWNNKVGWAVGMNEKILYTADGGKNWEAVDVQEGPIVVNCCFFDVAMTDLFNIWLFHWEHIYNSSDGGLTWQIQWDWEGNIPPGHHPSISMINSTHGWAVGGSTAIRYSEKLSSIKGNFDKLLNEKTWLGQNYPNPFNSTTNISYILSQKDLITLDMYNVLGEKVYTIFKGHEEAGKHRRTFDGMNFKSGIYFIRLRSSSAIYTKKVLLIR